ncbi:MAG TPA: hypothetical protein VLL05_15725, partial [Terriglobales bacterium]|nr:hypothetical protein [Terriglobales bacterium]
MLTISLPGAPLLRPTALRYRAVNKTMRTRLRWLLLSFAVLAGLSAISGAQELPEEGGREVQLWTGGGYTVPGGTN